MQFVVSRSASEFTVRVTADVATAPLPGSFSSPQIIYLHAQANALARHAIRPLRVFLPLPQDERERLEETFGQVPEHGDATLTYARADARVPFISDNPELWEATEADLQSQAMIQSKGLPLSDRVRATMLEAFSITEPNIAHVCGRLRLSRSTLLRRLDEGDHIPVAAGRNAKRAGDPLSGQERPEQPADRASGRVSRSERLPARVPEMDRDDATAVDDWKKTRAEGRSNPGQHHARDQGVEAPMGPAPDPVEHCVAG
jgi:hypothetical protein